MTILENSNILITGGAGALGKAILRRAHEEKWNSKITIFSTDAMKHLEVIKKYPRVNSIIGDVRDPQTVYNAVAGKDIVIHAAAVKHIPFSEEHSIDTYAINVEGSMNVLQAAVQHNTPHVLGISTDKVCHAANAYGASKYLMEKIFQEYSRVGFETQFHLVRYGNVLESTGSVIEAWKNAIARNEPIRITSPAMSRFFISLPQAVNLVVKALECQNGCILIPKMKALTIGKLAEYTLEGYNPRVEYIPLRAGEKMHETLLTIEEREFTYERDGYFYLFPTTSMRREDDIPSTYSSDIAEQLTKTELTELLNE